MLDSFLEKFSLKGRPLYVRLLVYGLYLIGPAAALLAGWNNFFNARLGWVSTEITRPHDAYVRVAPDLAEWRPSPKYEDTFFTAFSKHYFGQPSRWAAISADIDGAQLNIVLQNQASSSPVLVNSVSTVAILEDETPFPWRKLDTTARLSLQLDGDDIIARSTGLGPVTTLELTPTTAAGAKLARQHRKLLTEKATFPLRPAGEERHFTRFKLSDGKLSGQLFRRWPNGESIPTGVEVHQCQPIEQGDGCILSRRDWPDGPPTETGSPCFCGEPSIFETIDNVSRLEQLTDVVIVDEVRVDWRHADLKGEVSEGKETMTLDKPRRYYRRRQDLLTELPRLETSALAAYEAGASYAAADVVSDVVTLIKPFAAFADTAFGDKQTDRGVALISTEHNVSVADLRECEFAQSIKEPRELLAGAGYVAVHLDLDQTRNGRYLIRVLVNGEEVRALRLDILRPDDEKFDESDVDRFAERAPEPPSACTPVPKTAAE